MLEKASAFLGVINTPLMWVMVALHLALGVLGIVAPSQLRRIFGGVLPRWRIRLLGFVLMLIGAEIFVNAENTQVPTIAKTLSILLFVDGGVRLLIPMVHVVLTEWLLSKRNAWFRVVGLLSLCFAYLYYLAAQAAEVVEEAVEDAAAVI